MTPNNKASQLAPVPRQQIHNIPHHRVFDNGDPLYRYISMSKRTRKMISHPDDSDDGLLGESTYEILSDLSIPSHSDDDDDLSSLASLAEDSPDEDEDEDDDDEENDDDGDEAPEFAFPNPSTEVSQELKDTQSLPYTDFIPDVLDKFESAGIPSYTGLDQHEPLRSHAAISEDSLGDVMIQFEDDIPPGAQASLSYDVQKFTGPELDDLRPIVHAPNDVSVLHSALRCSLGAEPLNVTETFRVLYIGDESAKDEIFRKLGAALVVHSTSYESLEDSKSSSRFNVVPVTSFGNSLATPEVELVESFGLEMTVDTCSEANLTWEGVNNEAALHLLIKTKMWVHLRPVTNGYKLEAPGWRLPHLAIIYCNSTDDSTKRGTRACARSFLDRCGIPFLSISNKKLYDSTEDYHIDSRVLHLAVESRRTNENGARIREVYKEYPVDLQSFLSLDVHQLSRNLAVVVQQEDDDQIASAGASPSLWEKIVKASNDILDGNMPDHGANVILTVFYGLLLSTLCLWFSFAFASFMKPASVAYNTSPSVAATVDASTTTGTRTLTSLAISSSTKTSAKIAVAKQSPVSQSYISISTHAKPSTSSLAKSVPSSLMTVSTGVTSLSVTDIPSLPANESNEFAMYTISEGHIVLRSPQKFAALRRAPALIVHVKRKDQTVPVEVNKLFRGVYAIKMDLGEAWGTLNITVRTESKPIVNQSFVLDLGNPWLSTSAWKRTVLATSSDLKKVVNKASSKANVYAQKFQESGKKQIDMAKKDVKYLQKEAVKLKQEFAKQSEVAKRTVESQLKVWKHGLDELKLEQYLDPRAFKDYRQKLDEQVRKARRNANRLWGRGSDPARKTTREQGCKVTKKSNFYSWKRMRCDREGRRDSRSERRGGR
ncbi:hypothetical protein DRE_01746 [Drechslerella stenobrocha 248]|uniref:Uncharacterized protein n=1 Tax=Drechslerella stenobrocha 248 TaxID=1043628 RepID=W7HYF3_9PEZI|nr:hypothetical protein DRE_01746 [Drechslerella stenobrocha 248]